MRIDRCEGCGEHVDIASDHKPGCTRNAALAKTMSEVIWAHLEHHGDEYDLDYSRSIRGLADNLTAVLSAAGFGLVADAGAKALEDAADAVAGATMPFLDLGTCRYVAEHIRILAKDLRGEG